MSEETTFFLCALPKEGRQREHGRVIGWEVCSDSVLLVFGYTVVDLELQRLQRALVRAWPLSKGWRKRASWMGIWERRTPGGGSREYKGLWAGLAEWF